MEEIAENVLKQVNRVPGSKYIVKYIQNSYQNDPLRALIELSLFLFAIYYVLKNTYSIDKKTEIELNEKEIDELINDWIPEPLVENDKFLEQYTEFELNSIPSLARYCLKCGIMNLVANCPHNSNKKGKAPLNTVNAMLSLHPMPSGEESEGVRPINVVTQAQARKNPMINKENQTKRSSRNSWKARI